MLWNLLFELAIMPESESLSCTLLSVFELDIFDA